MVSRIDNVSIYTACGKKFFTWKEALDYEETYTSLSDREANMFLDSIKAPFSIAVYNLEETGREKVDVYRVSSQEQYDKFIDSIKKKARIFNGKCTSREYETMVDIRSGYSQDKTECYYVILKSEGNPCGGSCRRYTKYVVLSLDTLKKRFTQSADTIDSFYVKTNKQSGKNESRF